MIMSKIAMCSLNFEVYVQHEVYVTFFLNHISLVSIKYIHVQSCTHVYDKVPINEIPLFQCFSTRTATALLHAAGTATMGGSSWIRILFLGQTQMLFYQIPWQKPWKITISRKTKSINGHFQWHTINNFTLQRICMPWSPGFPFPNRCNFTGDHYPHWPWTVTACPKKSRRPPRPRDPGCPRDSRGVWIWRTRFQVSLVAARYHDVGWRFIVD